PEPRSVADEMIELLALKLASIGNPQLATWRAVRRPLWVIFVRHDAPRPTAALPSTAEDRPAIGSPSRNDEPPAADRFNRNPNRAFHKRPLKTHGTRAQRGDVCLAVSLPKNSGPLYSSLAGKGPQGRLSGEGCGFGYSLPGSPRGP